MSMQTAQSRSCSRKPGRSHAPGGNNRAFLGLSEALSPATRASRVRSAPNAREKLENAGREWRLTGTMAPRDPAAEPGEVILAISAQESIPWK